MKYFMYTVYLPESEYYISFKPLDLFTLTLQVLQRHLDTNCEMMKRITSPGADSANQTSSLTTTDNQHSNHSIAQVILLAFILARGLYQLGVKQKKFA